MNSGITLTVVMLVGFGIGVTADQMVRAEAKPPAHVISDIELTNADGYAKEYVPLATKALITSGRKRLASGGRTIALSGAPPASRMVVSAFDSLEKAQTAYISPAYLEARNIGDKYGKLRTFAVQGISQ